MNKEVQKKYIEMQTVQQQIAQISEQNELLQQQRMELANTVESLNDLKRIESEKELLTPISQGIFVSSKVGKVKELFVNVGSGIIVKKNVDDAVKLIEGQVVEIDALFNEFCGKISELTIKGMKIEEELKKLMKNV